MTLPIIQLSRSAATQVGELTRVRIVGTVSLLCEHCGQKAFTVERGIIYCYQCWEQSLDYIENMERGK